MRNLRAYIPVLLVVVIFAPSLFVDRYAGDQPLSVNDIALFLPVVAYFWPILMANKFLEDSYTYLSKDDKRNLKVLVLGLNGVLFIMWLFVLLSGGIPLNLGITTTIAFGLSAYDLIRLVNGLRKASDLSRVVWLHIFVPFFAAITLWTLPMLYTHWAQVPNPIATFFILRIILSIVDRRTIA